MEEKVINKIRKVKRKIRILYKNELRNIDFESDGLVDSTSLASLQLLSSVYEDLTDIIYDVLEIKNSKN